MSDQSVSAGGYASRRGVWGWIFFDWAAQPFFTVVITFILGLTSSPVWPKRQKPGRLHGAMALRRRAWQSPFYRPFWVRLPTRPVRASRGSVFAVLKILSLMTLWFAVPGANLFWVLLAFSIAMVSAEFSIVFNDSMMPRLVPREDIGRVSNLAWGLGYLGGMIVLIFVVFCLAASPETGKTIIGMKPLFGLDPVQGEDARITGPIAAIWYLIFVLPMFLFTPDQARGKPLRQALGKGLSELRATLGEIRKRPGVARFLVARMIYQDGVNAIIALGAGYAASLFHWSITEIGLFGMITNVMAIFSCLVASRMDTRFGSKAIVMISLVLLFSLP